MKAKRFLSILLAAAMLLTLFVLPAGAASFWDGEAYKLNAGPTITRLWAESDEYGTEVFAWLHDTADAQALAAHREAKNNDLAAIAALLGVETGEVEYTNIEIGVQVAYSLNGSTWVNDESFDPGDDNNVVDLFDLDGDGMYEYVHLPNENLDMRETDRRINVLLGDNSELQPYYAADDADLFGLTIKEVLQKRNQATLQGFGEYTGGADYDPDGDMRTNGFAVDLTAHPIRVKARYRAYTEYVTKSGGSVKKILFSGWGPTKTLSNETNSPADQGCIPNVNDFNKNKPVLSLVGMQKTTSGGVTTVRNVLRATYPGAMEQAVTTDSSLNQDERYDLLGYYYPVELFLEIRVGDGDWYYYRNVNSTDTVFAFDNGVNGDRDFLEALGYKAGDRVFLRARLADPDSVDRDHEAEYDESLNVWKNKLRVKDEAIAASLPSDPVELSLTGVYKIAYDTDGGLFMPDTSRLEEFDDETPNTTVDLTAFDYVPYRPDFVFGGWFDNPELSGSPLTSFDLTAKQSRTYYAKWTEKPYCTYRYDLGEVTEYVNNPNPTRVHEGTVCALGNLEYEGAEFLGWYSAPTGGFQVTAINFTGAGKETTLYARWKMETKTITYAGAGKDYVNNAKNPATHAVKPDGVNTEVLYAPEKTGYIFDGWFLDAEMKNNPLTYNETAKTWELPVTKDVTVYARFIRGKWDLTYEIGADVSNSANPAFYEYGQTVNFAALTRAGYTFDGWFADKALTTPMTGIKATDTGAKTVYAKWTAIPYTVTYDLRDPDTAKFFTNGNPATRTENDETVLKPLVPTDPHYGFLGWYDNVNYSGKPVEKIAKGTAKNVTVFAKVVKYTWGDVDFNGKTEAADARLVLRAAVGLEPLPETAKAWGDLDAHSAAHTLLAADARLVLRMAVGLDTAESLKLPDLPA